MKQRIQWIGSLFTIASAGVALGCGCAVERTRLAPVREVIVQQPRCEMVRPQCVIVRPAPVAESTTCLREPGTGFNLWTPFRTVGRVISAPFVAVGHALSPDRTIEPVGELGDYPTVTYRRELSSSYSNQALMPVGERVIVRRSILQPVGEQVIVHRTLQPVGERFITERRYRPSMLTPVGERYWSEQRYHKTHLRPVGERFIFEKRYHKTHLRPVGEQFISVKQKQQMTQKAVKAGERSKIQPVGERTQISEKHGQKTTTEPSLSEKQKSMLKSEKEQSKNLKQQSSSSNW